jgi:hypothetical protein
MIIVTTEEARMHLRVDSADDDPWFATWIPAVENAVFLWLKDQWRAYVPSGDLDSAGNPIPEMDSNGDPIPQYAVKAAVLVELAQQYRFRDGSDAGVVPSHWGHGYILGAGATSLLSGLRKSTVR